MRCNARMAGADDSDNDSDDAGLEIRRAKEQHGPTRSKKGTALLCSADNGLAGCACPPQGSAGTNSPSRRKFHKHNRTNTTRCQICKCRFLVWLKGPHNKALHVGLTPPDS